MKAILDVVMWERKLCKVCSIITGLFVCYATLNKICVNDTLNFSEHFHHDMCFSLLNVNAFVDSLK